MLNTTAETHEQSYPPELPIQNEPDRKQELDNLTPSPDREAQASEWYYEDNGHRNGPVSQDIILKLIKIKNISYGSLIWKKGLSEWTKVENTEFRAYLHSSSPPPLSSEHVKNTYLWILSFAPIIGNILETLITGIKYGIYIYTGEFWYITLGLNIVLCWLDSQTLKRAGYDINKFSNWIVLIPVYIYLRAKHLKHNHKFLIIWFATFLLVLVWN